jgi:Mn-dependent DtxR family transcriptional regulator
VRRHRILVLILTHYGLSADMACEEASRFESFVSREATDRICRSLGHPMVGPCGNIPHDRGCCPNPAMEGTVAHQAKAEIADDV